MNRSPAQSTGWPSWRRLCVSILACLWVAGASAADAKGKETQEPKKSDKGAASAETSAGTFIFYPPKPAAPRIQFLVSISESRDLQAKGASKLSSFIVGGSPVSIPIIKPFGLASISKQILVADTGVHGLSVLDLGQRKLRYFQPKGEAEMGTPIHLTLDAEGNRYVADSYRGTVMVYNPAGDYIGQVGTEKGMRPTAVAVTKDRVYVSEINSQSVRVYGKADRKLMFTIPPNREAVPEPKGSRHHAGGEQSKEGAAAAPAKEKDKEEEKEKEADDAKKEEPKWEPKHLAKPVGLALDSKGQVYVSDSGVCRVQVYDSAGKYLRSIGSEGDAIGQFIRPRGIAIDKSDRIYVVDAATQVCQIFDNEGRLLMFFGEPNGTVSELNLPAGICIDYANVAHFKQYVAPGFEVECLVLISNQYGDHKINVYALGQRKS